MTQQLIELILELNINPQYENNADIFLTDNPDDEFINLIAITAENILIFGDGSPNFKNMKILEDNTNVKVVKGEGDSFGWVTGVINTKKGKIMYG